MLNDQGRHTEAEAACREAIRLKADDPGAHRNLGLALAQQVRLREAEAAFREAARLKPDDPLAHLSLGSALRLQQRFAEAAEELRRSHELGSRDPNWGYPSLQWLRECERLAELDRRLPDVLARRARPAGPAEAAEFADLCSQKQLYASSARLAADAFAGRPALAEDSQAGLRYSAACDAAVAAAGIGADAAGLAAEELAWLRSQALAWLRAELSGWRRVLANNPPAVRPVVGQQLANWQTARDFAGVRAARALAALPADERVDWQRLWADVADLLWQVAEADEPPAAKR
jgi:hypothetical protein